MQKMAGKREHLNMFWPMYSYVTFLMNELCEIVLRAVEGWQIYVDT